MRMDFEKLSGLGIGTWGIGEDPKKEKRRNCSHSLWFR